MGNKSQNGEELTNWSKIDKFWIGWQNGQKLANIYKNGQRLTILPK